MASSARAVAALTHGDPLAGDRCVLWCIAIDRAVREGRLDGVHDGVRLLPEDRQGFWRETLAEAEQRPVGSFTGNGFTVTALQAAHAAITQMPVPDERPARHLQAALVAAVRIGNDTDTVAAIAGMVLGARWGASAVPFAWRGILHGWPGGRSADLVRLAVLTAGGGRLMGNGWPTAPLLDADVPPTLVALPGDDGILLGNLPSLADAVTQVEAVVSLCRVGTAQVPATLEHHEVWLIDQAGDEANPNLDLVIDEAVTAVRTFRAEGRRVLLPCVAGRSRIPMIAAAYLADRDGMTASEALERIAAAIPHHDPHNGAFLAALARRERAR